MAVNQVVYTIEIKDGQAVAKLQSLNGTLRTVQGTFAKTTTEVQNLDKVMDNLQGELLETDASFKRNISTLKQYQSTLQVGSSAYVKAGNDIGLLRDRQTELIGNGKTGLTGVSTASGGATTSVLELGRVISDAPYGIRGMANNVSQLASNMLFTAQQIDSVTGKVVGFGGVLRQMGRTFIGPLGILFAIQAVISALDFFWGSTKKAEEGTQDLNDELKTQITLFKAYEEQLMDANLSLEQRVNTLKSLSSLDKELAKDIKNANGDLQRQTEILKNYISGLQNELAVKEKKIAVDKFLAEEEDKRNEIIRKFARLQGQAIQNQGGQNALDNLKIGLDKELNELGEEKNRLLTEYIELLQKQEEFTLTASIGSVKYYEDQIANLKSVQSQIAKNSAQWRGFQDIIDEIQRRIDAIKPPELKGISRGSTRKFEQNLLDLSKEIDDFNKREEQSIFQSETTKLEITRKYQRLALEDKYNDFLIKEKIRRDEAIRVAKNEKEKANIERVYALEKAQADLEYGTASLALEDAIQKESLEKISQYNIERVRLERETREILQDTAFMEAGQERRNEGWVTGDFGEDVLSEQIKEERANAEIARIERDLAWNQMRLDTIGLNALAEAEILLNQEQLRNQLAKNAQDRTEAQIKLDQLELESKQRLIQDVISILGSASEAAGKNTSLGKALAVASTTISTYSAAQAAYESQIIPGDASSIPRAVIAAAASVASGLLKVKQILAVKVPYDKGGSAPSAQQGRTFDFNLVGSTGQNQLAQTIGGQVGQTIKAYVVGSEITNQQQFDNQIQGQATIGG